MNIEIIKSLKERAKEMLGDNYNRKIGDEEIYTIICELENFYTAYEKEKEKNKNAIDFINERKKTVNKDMTEGTRLQVGTFMWQVDELLEILKGVEEVIKQ